MTTNPTPEEIVQVAQSGNTGAVKSLTDLRLEKLEAKINELEKINAELRAANQELYSFASQQSVPAQSAPEEVRNSQVVPQAAQPVQPQIDEAAVKAREEANLQSVLAELGYRKAPISSQSSNDTQDGM